jgi:hypothetical protein
MARPPGRSSKFTPDLRQKIIDRLQAGATIKATCESVGIVPATYHLWMDIGRAYAAGEAHRNMPRTVEERERFSEFFDAATRAIADGMIHATVAFKQGMNPSKTIATTSETTEETKVNPKTGELYTYRKTITRTTTTTAPGDWRAAMEYLARRDPDEWARAVAQRVEVDATIKHIDMNAVEAEIIRRIEAGELSRSDVLEIVDHDESLAEQFFRHAQTRLPTGKDKE